MDDLPTANKRIAFVFTGGGSLGANQAGMVRALYEREVSPDFILGASIGALNASFIASRPHTPDTAHELADLWRGTTGGLFRLDPARFALAVAGRGTYFASPTGMRRILDEHLEIDRLEHAATPLHIIVTDVVTGEDYRLSAGNAAAAVLASSAVPGVLPPVDWAGRTLVDGGIANNTPIGHAVALGAERVYVLPAGNASALRKVPKGMVQMIGHWAGLIHERQALRDIEYFGDQTELVVMPPPFPQDVSPSDFGRAGELIERSHRAGADWLDSPSQGVGLVPEAMRTRSRPRVPGSAAHSVRGAPSGGGERVAFVFSGGGSLGAGQVGMLRALYENDITPDLILGSSVGALNASLIASRPPTPETARWLAGIWTRLRRRDLFPLDPVTFSAGISGARSYGVSANRLTSLLRRHLQFRRLEDCPVPLHVIATELLSGEEQTLSVGDAALAVRASMSFPGIFPPVHWGGHTLIAGGAAENTPISRAIELGATTVYVLPNGHPCGHTEAPRGLFQMIAQSGLIAHAQQLRTEIERLRDRARLIVMPPLCPQYVRPFDFGRAAELMEGSYVAGRELLADPGDPAGRIPRALTPHRHEW